MARDLSTSVPFSVAAPARSSRTRQALALLQGPLILSLAYFLGAQAAFYIGTLSDQIFALFWPPNVILFCALVIIPQRRWWLYIAAAFPAHVIAELSVGMPVPQLLVAFATNCMVALLNAYAVQRFIGPPPFFGDFRKAALYIVITAALSPAVSALGGAFVPILGGGSLGDYWIFWSHWYFANALPSITLGPVFLIWFSDGARWSNWTLSRRHIEPIIIAATLVIICVAGTMAAGKSTTNSFLPAVLLLPLPFVLWSTFRFGEKGASGTILIVTVILTWRTLHGRSLFHDSDPERNILALQLFLTGLSIPVLLLGASIDALRRTERTMRGLAGSVVRAQDEERRRIARDLHDSTGQNLIAATLIADRLEKAVPPAEKPALRQLEETLQQSIHEIRTVSYLLHPPLLDEAGLGLALKLFVEGYVERSGIAVALDVPEDFGRLPSDMELILFRLVQEALTNVSRHSNSRTARIGLARDRSANGHRVVLTIEDQGKGMPHLGAAGRSIKPVNGSRPQQGVGLASMRERLHQIGGRLDITSVPGHTSLKAIVPIPDARES